MRWTTSSIFSCIAIVSDTWLWQQQPKTEIYGDPVWWVSSEWFQVKIAELANAWRNSER